MKTNPSAHDPTCSLCQSDGGEVLARSPRWRIVLADDADFPGFCRVIWTQHVAEMTDLTLSDRHELMTTVFAVETELRATLRPDKINLASLGNQVAHVHWHVIPRWHDDSRFPLPVWAPARHERRDYTGRPEREGLEALKRQIALIAVTFE